MEQMTNVYESPLLQITEVQLEAVIAGSQDANSNMTEAFNNEVLNVEFNW